MSFAGRVSGFGMIIAHDGVALTLKNGGENAILTTNRF
jgi:hypothetical protein